MSHHMLPFQRYIIDCILECSLAHCEGEESNLRSRGISPAMAEQLAGMTVKQMLQIASFRSVMSSTGTFDCTAVQNVIAFVTREQKAEQIQQELVRRGAPLGMMSALYGLNGKDYASIRKTSGVPGIPGRPRALTEEQERDAWKAWSMTNNTDDLAVRYLTVANTTDLALSSLWSCLEQWSDAESHHPSRRAHA